MRLAATTCNKLFSQLFDMVSSKRYCLPGSFYEVISLYSLADSGKNPVNLLGTGFPGTGYLVVPGMLSLWWPMLECRKF
jgi:hypothetical protein